MVLNKPCHKRFLYESKWVPFYIVAKPVGNAAFISSQISICRTHNDSQNPGGGNDANASFFE